jgi:hypothetical protein
MRVRWIWPVVAQALVFITMSVVAGVLLVAGPGRTGDARRAWRSVGVGILLSAGGNLLWYYNELVANTPPFPSTADVLYLAPTSRTRSGCSGSPAQPGGPIPARCSTPPSLRSVPAS